VNVVLFTTYYPRHDRDYAGLFVSDLVDRVRGQGIHVQVVAPGDYNDFGLAYGLGIFRNMKRRPWLAPMMLISALRTLRRAAKDADLVHVYWLLAAPLGLLSGRPWVLTLQGSGTAGVFRDLNLLQRAGWLLKPILRRAEAVICVSQELTRAVGQLGANAVHIPNGTTVPDRVGEEASPPEILYAGRMVEEKGIRELADATAGLNLVVAGDGPLRHLIPNALGLVPHDELEKLYDRAAIVVIPSYQEGLSVVCLEAMAHGRPVVGSDIPGVAELVVPGVTGLLVPPRDASRLRQALLELLDDPKRRRQMGLAAQERILETASWDHVVPATIAVYEQALTRDRDAA